MTREEALNILHNASVYHPGYLDALSMAIQALEQEPCEDEYIKVPKKALKYRTAGMVAYNADWLKAHFDLERAVICGAQEPYDDAISRTIVQEEITKSIELKENPHQLWQRIQALPPVTPAKKVGRWIDGNKDELDAQYGRHLYRCQICNKYAGYFIGGTEDWWDIEKPNYCPNCGVKLVDSQESEVEE